MAPSNQVVGSSNLSGRTIVFFARECRVGQLARRPQFELPTDKKAEFDNWAVFGQVDRPQGDPEGVRPKAE